MNNSLTAISGVSVGHATHPENHQGCTTVVFAKPCPVAIKASGGVTRTYDATILEEGKSSYLMHGLFIVDGAHAGLEAASHILKGLREKGIGWKMNENINPSITGATIYSFLFPMKVKFRPEYGYESVKNLNNHEVQNGNVGVGTGSMVGKFSWTKDWKCLAMKTGIGSARVNLGSGALVCVLTVVNALGNVINHDGSILAGNRNDNPTPKFRTFDGFSKFVMLGNSNTTISIVGTNVKITGREDLRKVAEIASHGQVRTIKPINTSIDGDTVFAFSTNEIDLPLNKFGEEMNNQDGEWWKFKVDILAQAAAQAVQESVYDACHKAETIKNPYAYKGIIPSAKDYNR